MILFTWFATVAALWAMAMLTVMMVLLTKIVWEESRR